MQHVLIQKSGKAGRITLNRPQALNALSVDMCQTINSALDDWRDDPDISLLIIDAIGDRAFCAGGDIASAYHYGVAGDFDTPRSFFGAEYRMNAALFNFPKPVATFMQGFTMGGGIGVGCHASHRVVGDSLQMALPECSIGLVPDVGSTLLLAQASGRLGEFIGLTGYRMNAADAIHAEFADYYIPESDWPSLIAKLCDTGDWTHIDAAQHAIGPSQLADWQSEIDTYFGGETIGDIYRGLPDDLGPAVTFATKAMAKGAPLSLACTLEIIRRIKLRPTIEHALDQEYRFTSRALEKGDLIEGVRAAIIDKDKSPNWRHRSIDALPGFEVFQMLLPQVEAPLGLAPTL